MRLPLVIALGLLLPLPPFVYGQSIGTFNSVQPTAQTEQLVLPSTHTFQRIIRSGDALSSGGQLGNYLDFTGYVPVSGSSTNGYLSISSETTPAECAILSLVFNNSTKTWTNTGSGKVPFPVSEIGTVSRFCSGTVTPDNTIMVCEETVADGDVNGDGYQDVGWVIEIDPVTRTVMNKDGVAGVDKLWALGRQVHENVAIKNDKSVIYWGADVHPTGYMYKFVPDIAGDYKSGSLYVLETTTSLGTGTWQPVPNTTQAERNNTVSLSTSAGAYNFNRIEDVEIGPDNKLYFAATGPGVIYRFRDLGSTVDQLEVYVASANYDVDGTGPFSPEPWGVGNDNLAFDGEGNLWVLQDGTRNHIWVVSPAHSAAVPSVRLFATTPLGSEPTGITFTPDYKFLFMSFQHPATSNTTSQPDAASQNVIFNTHTTVVIARKEFLGTAAFPVTFTALDLRKTKNAVAISWSVEAISNHHYFEVERSVDGNNFHMIARLDHNINYQNSASLTYTDENLPASPVLYYRVKQCDRDRSCRYSATKSVSHTGAANITLFPLPAGNRLNMHYHSLFTGEITVSISDAAGRLVLKERKQLIKGMNQLSLVTAHLTGSQYFLVITSPHGKYTFPFTRRTH